MITYLDTAAIASQSKSADDIIRSATFPAAHAPSLDDSSRSEGGRRPYSLTVLGTVGSWWVCLHCCLQAVEQTLTTTLLFLSSAPAAPKSSNASLLLSEHPPLFGRYSLCLWVLLAQSRRVGLVSVAATLFSAWGSISFAALVHLVRQLNTIVPQMTWTEITETDFKLTFVCLSYIVPFCVFDIR